jgi:hypothetical protein
VLGAMCWLLPLQTEGGLRGAVWFFTFFWHVCESKLVCE